MKKIFTLTFLALASSALIFGQTRDGATSHKPEQEVMKAEEEYRDARLNSDEATLKRLYSEDYLAVSDKGQAFDKSIIKMQASSTTGQVTYDDVKVRIYGETAVVTGRVTTEEKAQSRFTRVWVKQQGRWQLVRVQSTRIVS